MEQGSIITLTFTAFEIEPDVNCLHDHLTIIDGYGTILMEKSCGSALPTPITSKSNIVDLKFRTDGVAWKKFTGWIVNWAAIPPLSKIN